MSFDADLELAFELADLAGRVALETFQRDSRQVAAPDGDIHDGVLALRKRWTTQTRSHT